MCGIAGIMDLRGDRRIDRNALRRMTDTLIHRGPDSSGYFIDDDIALGFRRLSIIDLEGGDQPIYNEDHSKVVVCNGEIYNYQQLRSEAIARGHVFRTESDVEALVHLYEDEGPGLLNSINGQFAFALYDKKQRTLLLARDHFGVNPLYYTVVDGLLIFASEIKAILKHPLAPRKVDLTGLDQIFSFPGLVSPRTLFKGIESLKSGHQILVNKESVTQNEYWDLDYPGIGELAADKPESYYVERLRDTFFQSVKYRLQADVPVGSYLSGGLDSSMVAGMIKQVFPDVRRHSFSIGFTDREICESKYQQLMTDHVGSIHHSIIFDWPEIADNLKAMVYHSECPVKETYNTCSMALSKAARSNGIPVILTGEGADELFAGYVGYRFDQSGMRGAGAGDLDAIMEEDLNERLWGDANLFYEINQYAFGEIKSALYSATLNEIFDEFNCLNFELVNKERLKGRHPIHQRSYLDFKLRLSDHLITDHGDRMSMVNSVEARYPFLDIDLVEFSREIPPELKLNGLTEKYILRKVAREIVPPEIINREKYGFHAQGSPYLLKQNIEWIDDLLSSDRIKREGYFNPVTVELLKKRYTKTGFRLNLPFESDLLMIVLSFGILLETFDLPPLN